MSLYSLPRVHLARILSHYISLITQKDLSPLFPALRLWRQTIDRSTLIASLPKASASQPTLTHSRGSSWARWWPRRTSEREQVSTSTTPKKSSSSGSARPAMSVSQTAPTDVSRFRYMMPRYWELTKSRPFFPKGYVCPDVASSNCNG